MNRIYLYFILLSAVVFFQSCKSDDTPSIDGPTKGDAFGYINFSSQSGKQINNPVGFSISVLDKLNTKPVPVSIDEYGKFSLKNLPMGDYEINGTLPGYRPAKIHYHHLGGEFPGFIGKFTMMEISRNTVELTSAQYEPGHFGNDLVIRGRIIKDEKYDSDVFAIRLLFGNDENTLSSSSYMLSRNYAIAGTDFEFRIPYYELNNYKFVMAFSDNIEGNCEYPAINDLQLSSPCTYFTAGPPSNILPLE